jgi:hypothetical protein
MNDVVSKYDIPADLVEFFADPPLLNNENRDAYYNLRNGIIATIKPTNTNEWVLTLDLADLAWDIRRLKNQKATLVNLIWKEALCMIIEAHSDGDPVARRLGAQELTNKYFSNEEGHQETLGWLAIQGFTEGAIAAQAATLRSPELEILDRQLGRARLTSMAITRDIQHHRAAGSWKRADEVLAIVDGTAGSPALEAPAGRAGLAQ